MWRRNRWVEQLIRTLLDAGHTITFDWTVCPKVPSYEEDPELCRSISIDEVNAVKEADILILLDFHKGVGMYIEAGVALASDIPVYVVSPHSPRSMFFLHPLVTLVQSVEEVLDAVGKGHDGRAEGRAS